MGHPLEFWNSADIILDGVVISTHLIETDKLVQHDVRVEQYFKNPKPQKMITVYGPDVYNEDWFYPVFFEEGDRALFYLKKVDDKYIILEHSIAATEKCDPRDMMGLSTLPGEPIARGGPTLFFDPYQTCNDYLTPAGFLRISLSPLKQIAAGIRIGDVGCQNERQLMFKKNNQPVCVKKSSIQQLMEKGWTLVTSSEQERGIRDPPLVTILIEELKTENQAGLLLDFHVEIIDVKENHSRPVISVKNVEQETIWSMQHQSPSDAGYLAHGAGYQVTYDLADLPEKLSLEPGKYFISVSVDKQTVTKKISVM